MNDRPPLGRDEKLVQPPLSVKAARPASTVPGGEFEFELNTDAALVDQRWFDFEEQHQRRFGLAIDHLKARVRGRSYDNDAEAARRDRRLLHAVAELPAAFYGDTGKATVTFVTENEAAAAVWEAVANYRSEEARSLTAIYSDDEPPDFFFGYRVSEWRRYEIGFLRSSVPLHLRVLFDSDVEVPLLGANSGASSTNAPGAAGTCW